MSWPRRRWRSRGALLISTGAIAIGLQFPAALASEDGGVDLPAVPGADALGAISVGHPHAGYLFNAVRMPAGKEWVLTVPDHAWGTEETVRSLMVCIRRVHEQFPNTPPVMLGSISAKNGGHLPPHKSHRTGRDVDVYVYRKPGAKWYKPATAEDMDRARTWALMKAVLTETKFDFILLDQKLQNVLEEHAREIGEDAEWLEHVFHGVGRYKNPMVKHVPGHVAHMHIRFASPIARERGRQAYERLVEQGHLKLAAEEQTHSVEGGDTLSEIAERYGTTTDQIKELNGIDGTTIYAGQKLVLERRVDLRGARDPVRVPQWPLPASDKSRVADQLMQLKELERRFKNEMAAGEGEAAQ